MDDPKGEARQLSLEDAHKSAEDFAIAKALAEAEEDIRRGRVSTQEEVKERAKQWRFKP